MYSSYVCLIGLFHRAIAQSGSVLNPWAFADSSTLCKRVQRFCKALGCEATSSEKLVEFLMKVPAEELVLGVNKALTEEVSSTGSGLLRWTDTDQNDIRPTPIETNYICDWRDMPHHVFTCCTR